MDSKQRQLIKRCVDLVIDRWRLIAASLLLAITAGLVYYLYVPKIYQSDALLSYEQRQINPAKMAPEEGKVKLEETLATLKEMVMSRNSLEKVITQFSLYEEARKKLPIEDVIESMRKDIIIKPAPKGDIFSVSFQGAVPQKVMRVTNSLASLFIEENLKYREVRATETSKYTQDELAMSKKVLDEKELLMRDYKLKYFNEMPEQRESNLARIKALNERSQGIQNSIQELERTKIMAQEQMVWKQRLAATRVTGETVGTGRQGETNVERLQRLRVYLSDLLSKYTEQHPEVRRTKQLIEQLEGKVGKEQPLSPQSAAFAPSRANLLDSMESQRLQLQLKEIDSNIKELRFSLATVPEEIEKYQKWVEAAPVREAEWKGLTRDYEELRRHYDYLVAQNLQAQSAEKLEHNQKGSKFKVIDSARLPEKPSKPNFLKILLAAIAAGLALSVGTIVAMEFIDTSFKDAREIEEYLGVPVISAIPYLEKDAETRRKQVLLRLSVALVSIYGTILLAAIAFLWIKGMIIV
ncbi:MAG: hypothetical protein JZU50_04940 [Desulfobulbaceae bacterium]|nr:hypothetical protein [Desulfobulbaceae bacterium]